MAVHAYAAWLLALSADHQICMVLVQQIVPHATCHDHCDAWCTVHAIIAALAQRSSKVSRV
jgi:hypothetical protein